MVTSSPASSRTTPYASPQKAIGTKVVSSPEARRWAAAQHGQGAAALGLNDLAQVHEAFKFVRSEAEAGLAALRASHAKQVAELVRRAELAEKQTRTANLAREGLKAEITELREELAQAQRTIEAAQLSAHNLGDEERVRALEAELAEAQHEVSAARAKASQRLDEVREEVEVDGEVTVPEVSQVIHTREVRLTPEGSPEKPMSPEKPTPGRGAGADDGHSVHGRPGWAWWLVAIFALSLAAFLAARELGLSELASAACAAGAGLAYVFLLTRFFK